MTDERALRPSLMLAAALALTALAYANVFAVGFVWDDHGLIETEPRMHQVLPVGDYFRARFWGGELEVDAPSYYRPLVTLSFALDWVSGDGAPGRFHLTNLLVHLLAVAALFTLARQRGASPLWAFALAAAFGCFTRLTEAVTWVSGRTDVFAGAAVLWALAVQRRGGEPWWRSAAAGFLVLVGLLSKEVALAGAAAVALREVLAARGKVQSWGAAGQRLAPVAGAFAAWAALRAGVVEPLSFAGRPWSDRLVLAAESLATYGWMLLTPWKSAVMIGDAATLQWPLAAAGLALATALVGLGVWGRGRAPDDVWVAVSLAVLAIAPVLHLIPTRTSMLANDRYLYLTVAALLWALASVPAPPISRAARLGVSGLLLLSLAAATHQRNHLWGNELEFWKAAVGERRRPMALGALADVYFERSLYAAARALYAEALAGAAEPDTPKLAIAKCDEALGDFDAAQQGYDALLAQRPRWKRVLYNRVLLELRRLRWDAAATRLAEAQGLLGADDATLKKLDEVLKGNRARAEGFPGLDGPLTPVERDRWLALLDEVGAVALARKLAVAQVVDGRTEPAQLERAAGYLAFRGEEAEARTALQKVPEPRRTELALALSDRLSGR